MFQIAFIPPWIIPARAGFTPGPRPEAPPASDHPRSRGVYRTHPGHPRPGCGSSPLARGLRHVLLRLLQVRRIIPARAGFTRRIRCGCGGRRDHPRSRGVYMPSSRCRTVGEGSSPLARGLRLALFPMSRENRIIPARAGFTSLSEERIFHKADHPRSRGVYNMSIVNYLALWGSSPLARGLQHPEGHDAQDVVDHPRSRGVYPSGTSRCGPAPGSSPLARGLPTLPKAAYPRLGIIPARAGFTRGASPRVGCGWDHPRSRGVYAREERAVPQDGGSSPLARGLHLALWFVSAAVRIIPARAGFTFRRTRSSSRRWDHPRSRGVYFAPTPPTSTRPGSSPLARGLHTSQSVESASDGIIPARAGFTVSPVVWSVIGGDHPRSRGVY